MVLGCHVLGEKAVLRFVWCVFWYPVLCLFVLPLWRLLCVIGIIYSCFGVFGRLLFGFVALLWSGCCGWVVVVGLLWSGCFYGYCCYGSVQGGLYDLVFALLYWFLLCRSVCCFGVMLCGMLLLLSPAVS